MFLSALSTLRRYRPVYLRNFTTLRMAQRDPSTLSNYGLWRTRHITAQLRIDFEKKCLDGAVELQLESLTDRDSEEIILDTKALDITSVEVDKVTSDWKIGAEVKYLGTPLRISLPDGVAKGCTVDLRVQYKTTDACTALQWLNPVQTSNGKHPYVFSHCEAIHARSLLPCQDTPDVKATVSFHITSPLPVVASGVSVDKPERLSSKDMYSFQQPVPIPSYLIALASGDIAFSRIGPRSFVAASPDILADACWELEGVETFIKTAEQITFPYKWGEYNVLVLPPSFPYGGMENPIYTFATPTLLSGDRQNVFVIAHEVSHSWSGNLVTGCNWEHFWLNEGWTTYLERRIGAVLHGESEFDFSAIIGWKTLEDAISRYGSDHDFTRLITNLQGQDPDDAQSAIAYEKGFHFLYYLDGLVGREKFDKFIPHYFSIWSEKSLDSYEFKDTFLAYFTSLGDDEISRKIATIDWESRFYDTGLPPKPVFDTSMVESCYTLAGNWQNEHFDPRLADVEALTGNQKLVFLEKIQDFETPLQPARSQLLGRTYGFATSKNAELKTAYLLIALKARDVSAYPDAAHLLGQVGRMKYVRPLYRALHEVDSVLARDTFKKHEAFYHPICRNMVAKDLGLVAEK